MKEKLSKLEAIMYRREIISNDQFHKALAVLISLIIVGLGITNRIVGYEVLAETIILLAFAKLGVILRLETLVHRQGGFLKKFDDPWENYRSILRYDKGLIVVADIAVSMPALWFIIEAYRSLWNWEVFMNSKIYISLYFASILLMVFLIVHWILAPKLARKQN